MMPTYVLVAPETTLESTPTMQNATQIDSTPGELVILTIIAVVSMVGNTCLWIVVLRNRDLRTVTNMFILKLSMADLLVGVINMPVTVYAIGVGEWTLPDNACVAFGFTNMMTLSTSVLSLCNISINRFFMVVYPSRFKSIYTKRNAVLMIFAVISVSALLSSFPLFGWCEYKFIQTHAFCFADWANSPSYSIFMISCCFGVPCCVMTVCNVIIFRAVRKSRRKVKTRVVSGITSVTDDGRSSFRPNSGEITDTGKQQQQTVPSIAFQNGDRDHQTPKSPKLSLHQKVTITIGLCRDGYNAKRRESYSAVKNCEDDLNTPTEKYSENLLKPPSGKATKVVPVTDLPSDIPKKLDTRATSPAKSMRRKAEAQRNEEIRLAFSLVIVVILFVLCWMPYCISMLLLVFYDGYVPREFHMFTLLIGYANSCCNPIIYGVMNRRFARGFKRLFCFWRKFGNFSTSYT